MKINADKIEKLRLEKLMTIREISVKAGISEATYHNLRKNSCCMNKTLKNIAIALECDPKDLV